MALKATVGSVGGGIEKAERGNCYLARSIYFSLPSYPCGVSMIALQSLCPVRNVCTDIS